MPGDSTEANVAVISGLSEARLACFCYLADVHQPGDGVGLEDYGVSTLLASVLRDPAKSYSISVIFVMLRRENHSREMYVGSQSF